MSETSKLTTEQKEMVKEVINASDTEEDKLLADLPSNKGVTESDQSKEPVTEEAVVTLNTVTGANNVMNQREIESSTPNSELVIDEELQRMLSLDVDDVYTVPESLADIKVSEDMLRSSAEKTGIKSEEDMAAIIPLIDAYRSKQKLDWYSRFPESLKKIIDKMCLQMNNTSKEAKNLFASEILDEIVRDAQMDKIVIDMQESIQKAYDMSPLMEMVLDQQRTLFEDKLIKTIDVLREKRDNAKEPEKVNEKIEQLNGIIDAYRESYTCEDLVNTIKKGKVRVKPFDISKYNRHCREFLLKYEGDTPFVIHDVGKVAPVLIRKLGDQYTSDQIVAAVIAFMMYSKNKNSKNVVDHTYMSYFISNIINLDAVTTKPEQDTFSSILLDNIEKVIRAINNLD